SDRVKGVHSKHLTRHGILRTGVIYGANGAGKSNLFKALARLKDLASNQTNLPRDPFRFSQQENVPTVFDLIFSVDGKHFRYGVAEGTSEILEEWYSYYDQDGLEHIIYERKRTEDGTPKILAYFSENPNDSRLSALATVGVPPFRTFLASALANLQKSAYGELAPILDWFENLQLVSPSATVGSLARMLSNGGFRAFASDILRLASTGVDRLKIEKKELSEETLERLFPGKFGEAREALKQGVLPSVRIQEGLELCYELKNGRDSFYTLSIGSEHKVAEGDVICMNVVEESDGTRRLLNLLPALYHMTSGASVFFID
ncbi:MAG: ATP-binding protein, partial [Opitutales bacterium]|nr:ATP-binding protein [Opitutales bacterium]